MIAVRNLSKKYGANEVLKNINIQFELKGQIDGNKALKAIQMSMDKYCSATAQLEPSSNITHSLVLNGETFEA
jgi:putative redox protein